MDHIEKQRCGIDEAGRGPLAGPLVIAGVILEQEVKGLMDSKKLSEKRRELLYPQIIAASRSHIAVFTHTQIDQLGISDCLHRGLEEIKASLPGAAYLFDGNSTFGTEGIETMVKADMKISEVSAASILAKVTRDRMMRHYATRFSIYGFEKHKGYGTPAHIEAIRKYGRCTIHRHTFKVKALDEPTLF
ncbi:MAG TPA: ribonuclease HII [Epsilonproteobacteria bacterium]|nr:ribonuclease HII [Campylobacterota bacterium]HHD72430.1 ribonuclease HII [Campylobacterota bacterium]